MLFFELLQVAVGRRERLSLTPSDSEWQHLFLLSEQHALQGVCYSAVCRLPQDQWPSEENLINWIWLAQRTAERNELISSRSAEACDLLTREGFDVCLLKGQSNALLYGEMAQCRQSGDVDLWCIPHERPEHHPKRRVIDYVRRRHGDTLLRFHHIDFPIFPDVETELHFTPIYLNNPLLNRRLNRWYRQHRDTQMRHRVTIGGSEVAVPTREFNMLYQLLHIYKHIFEEGVGMRQMMDYYFVLNTIEPESADLQQQTADYQLQIRALRLERLAGAVMYVMQRVFGMKEEELPWPPSRREGIALLSEIMQTGNFGQYDTRYDKETYSQGVASMLHRFWRKTKRNLALALDFPHEGLWEPWFRLYHFFWRILYLWKI